MPSQPPLSSGWALDDLSSALSAFLKTLPQSPRLLALGEPTHDTDAFPQWCNHIFRTLAHEYGFRSVAIESDAIAGLGVNDFVKLGHGTVETVMQTGFSHGFGARPANRQLVEWLRAHNAGRDPAEHLRFYGFDASTETRWATSPRASILALHTFLAEHVPDLPVIPATILALCGEDTRWTNPAASMDATQSVGADNAARTLRWLVDDLITLLEMEAPRLAAHPDALWHARLHARTAQGLLRYHAVMADRAPHRLARMLTLRDVMMADTLMAIVEREAPRGPTLVFGHNGHLHRRFNQWRLGPEVVNWCPAGVRLTERLGDRYAVITTVVGPGQGGPVLPGEPPEGQLTAPPGPARLFASRTINTDGNALPHSITPDHLQRTDGLLYLPAAEASPST